MSAARRGGRGRYGRRNMRMPHAHRSSQRREERACGPPHLKPCRMLLRLLLVRLEHRPQPHVVLDGRAAPRLPLLSVHLRV